MLSVNRFEFLVVFFVQLTLSANEAVIGVVAALDQLLEELVILL